MALGPRDLARSAYHGAQLLTLRDESFPIVHFTVAFRHGAETDAPGALGAMSTLLPLLLRGTKGRDRAEFNGALEALGSDVDTAVGHEMAYLHGSVLKEHFAATVALLAEALAEPALAQEELRPLVEETREELRSERDDDDTVADLFLRRTFYGNHRLATPAVGTVHDLARLDTASVAEARRHLAADRLVVGVAGDVTGDEVQAAFAPLIDALDPKAPTLEVDASAPLPQVLTLVVVDKPERTQVQLRVARPGVHVSHADSVPFWLGVMAFGGTFTSPLTREVRDIRGWSYFASADFRRRSRTVAPVVLRSAPALGDAVDCLALELELFDKLADGELAREPVELARAYLAGRLPFQTATAFELLGQAVSLEVLGLSQDELWAMGPRLEALDPGAIGPIMARHLGAAPAVAVLVGPKEALVEPLRQRFPKANIQVVSYIDGLDD